MLGKFPQFGPGKDRTDLVDGNAVLLSGMRHCHVRLLHQRHCPHQCQVLQLTAIQFAEQPCVQVAVCVDDLSALWEGEFHDAAEDGTLCVCGV